MRTSRFRTGVFTLTLLAGLGAGETNARGQQPAPPASSAPPAATAPATPPAPGTPWSPTGGSSKPTGDPVRLVEEARVLAEAGKWREACQKLATSFRIDGNIATELKLADCLERTGKTATAWLHYNAVARGAGNDPARERAAKERAAKLEPTVDKIVIVPPDQPDLRVEKDGRAVAKEDWSQPLPADPGEHTIHVWSPGKDSYDTLVTVSGRGATIRIEVPLLEDAIPWRLAPGSQVTSIIERRHFASGPEPARAENRSLAKLRTVGYGVGVVGVASVLTGVALYGVASADQDSACDNNRCVPVVGLVAGGAVLAALGIALIIIGGE